MMTKKRIALVVIALLLLFADSLFPWRPPTPSAMAKQLTEAIRAEPNNVYGRGEPLAGSDASRTELLGPLLKATGDDDRKYVSSVAWVLGSLRSENHDISDEETVAKTLIYYLDDLNKNVRYYSARTLLDVVPEKDPSSSGFWKQVGSLWSKRLPELERRLNEPEPRAGVLISVAILRRDPKHQAAVAYLREHLDALKAEYANNVFGVASAFKPLGNDARHLALVAIRHAQFPGSWSDPGINGRYHLQLLGDQAIPSIVAEIERSESVLAQVAKKGFWEEHRWFITELLHSLELMGLNAKLTGTDLTPAVPAVTRLAKSTDEKIKEQATKTLKAIAPDN